jgi:hypothetical protein
VLSGVDDARHRYLLRDLTMESLKREDPDDESVGV